MKTATIKQDWRTRLAHMALSNVYFGGASAMVIMKRAIAMNLPSSDVFIEIVDYVYHSDNVEPYEPIECQWCGHMFLPCDNDNSNCCSAECTNDYYN